MIKKCIGFVLLFILSQSFLNAETKQERRKVIGNYELVKSAIVRNWTKHPDYKKFYPAGTLVNVQVRCVKEGKSPYIKFYFKDKVLIDRIDATDLVGAHIGSHHEDLETMKKGKLYEMDAIIVNGGQVCYATYWLHVERFKEIKEKQSN